jgi:hypothetical protein
VERKIGNACPLHYVDITDAYAPLRRGPSLAPAIASRSSESRSQGRLVAGTLCSSACLVRQAMRRSRSGAASPSA